MGTLARICPQSDSCRLLDNRSEVDGNRMLLMPFTDLQKSLSTLIGTRVMLVSSAEIPEEAGVRLHFSDGAVLLAIYWRTISKHWATLTSFDHGQKYGLTSPIDATETLQRILVGKPVEGVQFDQRTGDLIFAFEADIEFHVFNFTGYEVWEITFSDGTGEYSNNAFESASDQ
jgi:hypothetical protein